MWQNNWASPEQALLVQTILTQVRDTALNDVGNFDRSVAILLVLQRSVQWLTKYC